ncbi:hypothetical protein GCM10009625_22200 [Brachybacterium fresconis]
MLTLRMLTPWIAVELDRGRVIVVSKRKKYTSEYRREVAALVLAADRLIPHTVGEVDVGALPLRRWAQQDRERRGPPLAPNAPLLAEEWEELKDLRRQSTSWRRATRPREDSHLLGFEATRAGCFELTDAA